MIFDPKAAKSLAPGQHIIVAGCPGLRLERTESFATWTYRYRSPVDGKLRQVKIGHWPAVSFAKAMGAWEALRDKREAGEDPAAQRREARAAKKAAATRAVGYTVERLIHDYMEGHVRHMRKPASYAEMQRVFKRLAGPLVDRQAADITRTDAFEFLEALASTPVSARLIRQELAGAWDYALDAGRLPDNTPNWWRLVMKRKLKSKGRLRDGERTTAKRVLRGDEVGVLIGWLPHFAPAVADLLTLYLWTGCRGGELVQMEGTEVTEEADGLWWTCPKAKTKNARHERATDLRVPLVGRAATIVKARLALYGAGYLFPAESERAGEPYKTQRSLAYAVHYRQPYNKARPEVQRERLPVTHWAPHDLRRTVRTMLAALGCSNEVAESVLGHLLPGVQGVYNLHAYDSERREWLTRLDAHMEALASAAGLPARP